MEPLEFDFIELAYQRLVRRLSTGPGLSTREYYKLCGNLFRLRKRESWSLLRAMKKRYGEQLNVNHMRVSLRNPFPLVQATVKGLRRPRRPGAGSWLENTSRN